jgi:dipeptidase E
MRNILLTSTGLEHKAIIDRFLAMIPKDTDEMRILFIPTASRTEEEKFYVRKSFDQLLALGVRSDNICWFDPEDLSTHRDRMEIDCIYVCGGNPFFLLKKLKECGYYAKILEWVNEGLLYIGVSAGSMIAAPDINYICWANINDCGLEDTKGLSFITAGILPHYTADFAKAASELREKGFEVLPQSDSQAVAIQGDDKEIIG